jgi:uncharacterized Ntn-hydrolase superfamily protein
MAVDYTLNRRGPCIIFVEVHMHPSTFSIVAYDSERQEWGVATESKFLAVGAVVPWARAGVGAIATQALANTSYGPRGLELLAKGASAEDALLILVAEDDGRAHRQLGIVDARGGAASSTGNECLNWAGGVTGPGFACQGNILVDRRTVDALAEAFVAASGELADRLVTALLAGQAAGGDRRGQQSAALLVVREGGGYAGLNDRYLDLRVDDDPQPIARLRDLLELHHLYFGTTAEADLLAFDEPLTLEIQLLLSRAGHYQGRPSGLYDDLTRQALETLFGVENLEDRWRAEPRIDPVALDYLRRHYPVVTVARTSAAKRAARSARKSGRPSAAKAGGKTASNTAAKSGRGKTAGRGGGRAAGKRATSRGSEEG